MFYPLDCWHNLCLHPQLVIFNGTTNSRIPTFCALCSLPLSSIERPLFVAACIIPHCRTCSTAGSTSSCLRCIPCLTCATPLFVSIARSLSTPPANTVCHFNERCNPQVTNAPQAQNAALAPHLARSPPALATCPSSSHCTPCRINTTIIYHLFKYYQATTNKSIDYREAYTQHVSC